jgi:maltose alpha-D-glucosyltransferase/alpha-amylase
VHNQGDAWKYTLEAFDQFLMRCRAQQIGREHALIPAGTLTEMAQKDIPPLVRELIGSYLDSAAKIGQRTGELHVTLANVHDNPDFTPEPFSLEYRRSRYASMCRLASQTCSLLKGRFSGLPSETDQEARQVVQDEPLILDRFRAFLELETRALRIRCHGDYHLGQVLWTGQDFLISDFEGEPARPLNERRMKHTPILDVAGMLRSFYYVPYAALSRHESNFLAEGVGGTLDPWIRFWYGWVSSVFLKSYLGIVQRASFWPESPSEFQVLLAAHLLEKTVYEVSYELNHRPDWVRIPVRGVREILETTTSNA